MFGIILASSDKEPFTRVLYPIFGFIAYKLLFYSTTVPISISAYDYALAARGLSGILLFLPIRNENNAVCFRYSPLLVVFLNMLDLSSHPSFNTVLSSIDNDMHRSIMESLSYSLFSNPLLGEHALAHDLIITTVVYFILIAIVHLIKRSEIWCQIKIHREVSLVMLLDGILRAGLGVYFILNRV